MNEKKFPWSKKDKVPAPFEAVYAGPEYFNSQNTMSRMGYAGPGAPAPVDADVQKPVQDDPDAKYCPCCGSKVGKTQPFCHECGTVLPQDE